MFSLLRSEWYQVKKSLSVKIAFVIVLAISVILGFNLTNTSYFEEYETANQRYLLYGGGSLSSDMSDMVVCMIFASLFSGWLISGAFENRTIQEAISYGKSRTKVYCAKIVMFVFVVTSLCLVYWFGSSMAAFLQYGLGTPEIVGNLCSIKYIAGMVFAGTLAYISLFTICGLIGFLNRKVGATMGICFVVILCGARLLAIIVPEGIRELINYTPLGLYNQVLKMDVQWADIWKTSCISLAWIVLIYTIGLWRFKKTELK